MLTKWLLSAILDVRNSLSIAFLAISDRYATLFILEMFDKIAAVGHLDVRNSLSIAFLAILDQNGIFFFWKFCTKWPPADILDVRKSLLIGFMAIHFRLIGHFGCLKIPFNSNSDHFRSMQNLIFLAAILDVRKSLSIAFLAISDRSGCQTYPITQIN